MWTSRSPCAAQAPQRWASHAAESVVPGHRFRRPPRGRQRAGQRAAEPAGDSTTADRGRPASIVQPSWGASLVGAAHRGSLSLQHRLGVTTHYDLIQQAVPHGPLYCRLLQRWCRRNAVWPS